MKKTQFNMKPTFLPPPKIVNHHTYVIHVYRRDNNLWFVTLAKDAIQTFISPDLKTKEEALALVILKP